MAPNPRSALDSEIDTASTLDGRESSRTVPDVVPVDLYVRNHDHRRPYDFDLRVVTATGETPLDRTYRLPPGDSRYVGDVPLPVEGASLVVVEGDVSNTTTVDPDALSLDLVEIEVGNGLVSITPRH